MDVTIGNLLQSRCNSEQLRATGTRRGIAAAALFAAQREILEEARLSDARALADVARVTPEPSGLVLRGAADLSPQLLGLLVRIHRASRSEGGRGVVVALPRIDAWGEPLAPVAERVERSFADEPDAPELLWEEPPDEAALELVDAKTPEAEARAAAAAVLRALSEGASIDRIAIAIPDGSEALAEALRAALTDAGVPFSEARGRSARQAPEVRALLSIARMATSRIERDRVVELLRTPGLHAGSWVDAQREADAERRAIVMAHRLRDLPLTADRSGALFVEAVTALVAGDASEAWIAEAARRIVSAIDAVRAVKSRSELSQVLFTIAHRLRLGEPSAAELQRALKDETTSGARLALEAIGEGAVALREALAALEDAARHAALFGLDRPALGLAELASELELSLDRISTSPKGGAGRAGAVRITSPRELAGIDHDLVIVMGLGARAYGGDRASDPWLDERTISLLPPSVRPRSPRERRAVAAAEIAWAISHAGRALLTRSTTDDEGREADPPHAIFTRALEQGHVARVEPHSRLSARASIVSPRGAELVALARGAPPSPELWARVGIERERARFFLDPSAPAGAYTGRIPERWLDALAERVGGHAADRSVSVTTIERAAGCAFRAFSERVLGARRAEDALESGSARDRGTQLHRALFVGHEALRELAPSSSREDVLAELSRRITADLASGPGVSPLAREARALVVRDALALLGDELEHPSSLVYFAGERRFGRGAAEPMGPLEIVMPDGARVFVDGQIDRIDRSTDGATLEIVDYKTGPSPSRKAFGHTVFQLPLYAAVARRAFGGEALSAVYVSVRAGGAVERSPRKPSEATLDDEELARIQREAGRVVVRLWSGDASPRPAHPKQCLRCDARDLCRRPAVLPKGDGDDGESPAELSPASVPPKEAGA